MSITEQSTFYHARFVRRRQWLPRLSRRATAIIVLIALVAVALAGGALYLLGPLNPTARITTLATFPAAHAPAAYTRVTTDSAGWVWTAQSAAGLATKTTDQTVLTVLNPDTFLGDPIQVRLCLACGDELTHDRGGKAPAITRIDDIAPVMGDGHSIYIGGWTAKSPIVAKVELHTDAQACNNHAPCVIVTTLLDETTQLQPPDQDKPSAALHNLLAIGVQPLLALATAPNGHLYCYLSDRGRAGLVDQTYNLLGGYQGLFRYTPASAHWDIIYAGPAGKIETQRLSPTATVTAIAVDAQEHNLYLADADHFLIMRMDLRNTSLSIGTPLIAATAITRFAGQPLQSPVLGTDVAQGIAGWQGDGGPAASARIGVVRGMAFDGAGDLLFSDASNARIRMVTPDGSITTVAGATVGTDNTPEHAALSGVLGITIDAKGRIFAIQNTTSGASLRVINWGWSAATRSAVRASASGTANLSAILAGLPTGLATTTLADVISPGSCVGRHGGSSCAAAYVVAAGGPGLGQTILASPAPLTTASGTGTALLTGGIPIATAQLTNSSVAVVASDQPANIAFVQPYAGCCTGIATPPPVPLPTGTHATGLALLAPTTDAQLSIVGSAYILVATTGGTDGADLLVYRANAETCGMTTTPTCTHFPGLPTLIASIVLAPMQSTGAVAALLSDDGTHAFALVSHPQDNQVSAIDLSAVITGSITNPAVQRIAISSPGAIVPRHDGSLAYISAGDGTIALLTTSGWLSSGVPPTLANTAVSVSQIGDRATITTALALSGDDARLYAALRAANGATTLVALSTGEFGAPASPHVTGRWAGDAHLTTLVLAPGETRLLTLAAPNGMTQPGLLHAYITHDPALPDRWLDVPSDLHATPTAPDPRGLTLAQLSVQ